MVVRGHEGSFLAGAKGEPCAGRWERVVAKWLCIVGRESFLASAPAADLAMIRERYPNLAGVDIDIRPLDVRPGSWPDLPRRRGIWRRDHDPFVGNGYGVGLTACGPTPPGEFSPSEASAPVPPDGVVVGVAVVIHTPSADWTTANSIDVYLSCASRFSKATRTPIWR